MSPLSGEMATFKSQDPFGSKGVGGMAWALQGLKPNDLITSAEIYLAYGRNPTQRADAAGFSPQSGAPAAS